MSAAPADTAPPAGAAPAASRVLIVEDDAAQARLVELLVTAAGLASAGTAATADDAVRLAPSADVVLMDYRLAGPRSGLDALRELRETGYAGTVIMMTGHGSERVAAEALHLGANDYIIKDDGFTQLLPEVLARAVRIREMEHQLALARHNLIRAERRAAIGEIVVALSHEINNPLMALSTQLDLLALDQRSFPPTSAAALAQARAQLGRIAELLRRLAELDHEETTTYVGGTRMTDLTRPPDGPKAGPGR